MDNPNNDSFIRWQSRTIEQMGYFINTLLAISIATSGYTFSFLLEHCLPSGIKYFLLIGVLFTLLCITLLLCLTLNRLKDFRITAQIARKREKGKLEDIEGYRKLSKEYSNKSWLLLQCSTYAFMLGVYFTVIGFAIQIFIN